MKILISAFDPFGNHNCNSALEVLRKLPDTISGSPLIKVVLPTVFTLSGRIICQEIDRHQPDVIVALGQAGGRPQITVERVAINIDDALIEDNRGHQPIDVLIQEEGDPAYFSTLPIKAIVQTMLKQGLPAAVSNSAGTFVCNHVMYQILYHLNRKYPEKTGGFIHLPYIDSQTIENEKLPSFPLRDLIAGIKSCLHTIIDYQGKNDIPVTGGRVH